MAIFSGIVAAVSAVAGAVSSFVGGIAALGGVGSFLIRTAAGVGLNLLAKAIAGKPKSQEQGFSVQGKLQSGGTVARSIIVGRSATAGSLVYANSWGTASKTPNAYTTQVIALADYPVKAITGLLVNGIFCELGTEAHEEYGLPVLEYRRGSKDHLWVKFYDGTQTAADSFLVNRVSSSDRPYETTRVGRGIAYAICTSRVNDELFTGFPQFKFVIDGARFYDPSKDDTVGGTGTQRWADPATWGGDGDHLPVVQAYNLLRGVRWSGQWLYGLQSTSTRRIPAAHAIAQIAKCRKLVAGLNGQEATYRSGAEIQVGAPIRDALEGILTAGQGRLAEIGGIYKPYVGEPDAPVMSFTDDDILSTEPQTFTPFFGLANTINGITATYPSAEDGWNPAEAPPLLNPGYEAQDGDRRLLADVDLDFVPYEGQVQRLMKSALAEARRARRHTIVMPPKFWPLEPGDVVSWTSERNGYIAKRFRVDGVIDNPNLDVVLDITEVDPTDYDWDQNTDYRTPVRGSLSPGWPAAQPMYGWQAFPDVIYDENGIARRPSIRVSCDPDQDDVRNVWVQVRLKASQVRVFDSDGTKYAEPYSWVLNGVFLPKTTYQVRGKFVPISDRETEWSSWIDVTTDEVKLVPGLDFDPYSGVIGLDQLDDDLKEYQDWLGSGRRELLEKLEELDLLVAAQEFGNALERQQIREQITATRKGITADYTREINVLISADAALATRIESLTTTYGTNAAMVSNELTALASADAAFAQSLTTLQTSFGSFQATTAQRLSALADEDEALALSVTQLEAEVFDPATGLPSVASAVSSLRTRVTNAEGDIEAYAEALDDLEVTVGNVSASGRFRTTVMATPSGAQARVGIAVAASSSGATSSAAFYLDALSGGQSRAVFEADQFIVVAGGNLRNPFVVDGTAVRMNVANIGTINAGILQNPNGKMTINVANGTIEIWD
jgi:hypothetical protein